MNAVYVDRRTGEAFVDTLGSPAEHLPPRQQDVLACIAEGLNNAEIGRRLGLTERTAQTYVTTLFKELGARNRAHAVHLGYQAGLLRVD